MNATIDSIQIIGEELNYSIPRITALMDSASKTDCFDEIKQIARKQESKGATYLDVNIGLLPVEMMASMTRAIQEAVDIPLCFDSDDVAKLAKGLEEYDYGKGAPILNSATESRIDDVLALRNAEDCQVVLLVSERVDGDSLAANISCDDAIETAKRLFSKATDCGFQPDQIYIDPGMPPIGADQEGLVSVTLDTIERINSAPEMTGIHTLVGLTNLTFGLPPKLKLPLQNAFITLAIKNGLDTIIGCPGRKYKILPEDDLYMQAFLKVLESDSKLETLVSEIYPLMK